MKVRRKAMVVGGPFPQSVDPVLDLVPTGKGKLAAAVADALEEHFETVERIGNFPGGKPCTFDELHEMMLDVRILSQTNAIVFMPHLPNIIVEQSAMKIRASDEGNGYIKFHRAPKIVEGLKHTNPEMLLVPFKMADDANSRGATARWMLNLHASLAVYSIVGRSKEFFVADALGNDMPVTKSDLPRVLAQQIRNYAMAVRRRSVWKGGEIPAVPHVESYVRFSRKMAPGFTNIIRNAFTDRWPGNYSFRCAQGFMSARAQNGFVITKRNVAKAGLSENDFVFVASELDGDRLQYWGDSEAKPSIDSPVHRHIYEHLDWVQGIVHGHLRARRAACVCEYDLTRWPCGAENEGWEIVAAAPKDRQDLWVINIEGHGFIALIGDTDPKEALRKLSRLEFDFKFEHCAADCVARK